MWVRLSGLYEADYVVIFDWFGIGPDDFGTPAGVSQDGRGELDYSCTCYLEKPVFIGIGQVANDRQQGRKEGMYAHEGLERFKEGGEFRSEAREVALHGPTELGRIIDNDETYTPLFGGRCISRRKVRKQKSEVIQCGAQIVDAIADNQSPTNEIGRRPNLTQTDPYAACLSPTLEKGFVTALLQPFGDFAINRLEVFFSAGQLGKYTCKI